MERARGLQGDRAGESELLHAGMPAPQQDARGDRQDCRKFVRGTSCGSQTSFMREMKNVHPILMYDEHDEASVRGALAASGEILRYCVSVGGTVTGEHGVGIEKVAYMQDMFSPEDLSVMHRIRRAMVPCDTMNPFKVLPREGVNRHAPPAAACAAIEANAANLRSGWRKWAEPESNRRHKDFQSFALPG